MRKNKTMIALGLSLLSAHSFADVNISGFASINAGKVLSGEGVPHYGINEPTFLADFPMVSRYTDELSFDPETLFGIQLNADVGEGLSAVAQIVSRGADDFNAEFEWAYLSYEVNENWTIQAGKKRLPLFYYSDFYDVGYAYVWMRAPADSYTWQIINYTGANALYTGEIGDWSISGNLYTGREDDKQNKFFSEFIYQEPTREIWKDITGLVLQTSNDWLEVRTTYMTYTNQRYRDGEPVLWNGKDERDGKFYGLAVNANFGDLFILSELNRLDLNAKLDSKMLTIGYNFDGITPFIAYSELEEENEGGENHNTSSVGVRWDFHPSAAFKVQYDQVKDNSHYVAVAGDSKALTFGIDLVF